MTVAVDCLRIGVDVGGTNTDAVILNLATGCTNPVLATFKAPTTVDIASGIEAAVRRCLEKADVDKSRVQAVSIGTTSFVNSLIERNARKLERVAVIRLCGPYSRPTVPFASFPYDLRNVLEGPIFFAQGGLQVDGREIMPVDPEEIKGICAGIRDSGVKTVAISGIYSPIDSVYKQEESARDILESELPGINVTISKEVANLGLLERENATILNAALLSFAAVTVAGFQDSMKALQLDCPLFLTSNDGTLMTCQQAAQFPIKTFSSGPTNSMRGAHFLACLANGGSKRKETAMVIDIGGTTTEIGVLLPTGFPRQAGARHELCGVPLNFSMPHVHSFGLGGGSRVRKDSKGKTTIGPDSIGYEIDKALCFGGETFVTSDVAVALGQAKFGDVSLTRHLSKQDISDAQARMKIMIELALDAMKTSIQDVPVYLVGGGAILAPEELNGVSQVHRFPFHDAANAIGAACAEISAVIDTFEDTSTSSISEVRKKVEKRAIDMAVASGANPSNCKVVESEAIPIAYTTGRCRFYVKAAGEWIGSGFESGPTTQQKSELTIDTKKGLTPPISPNNVLGKVHVNDEVSTAADMLAYKPDISNGEWTLSGLDLDWIATGCYILGCGGGGSPQHQFLALREMYRAGQTCKVIDLSSLSEDGEVIWGGGIGSPEVSSERLCSEEYNEAISELIEFMNLKKVKALAALEIGGGNGMISMMAGSTRYHNLPVIDGDFMGRAYPTGWQTTPNVYDTGNKGELLLPNAMSSGDGNVTFMTKAKHYKDVDAILRAGCVEMGTHAGAAIRPLTRTQCETMMVKNTVSQAWRLGRAVALANKQAQIGNIGSVLVDALGGPSAAKVLFRGKVVEVERKMYKGHTVGELIIQALASEDEEDDDPSAPKEKFQGTMFIPFKNENLMARHLVDGVEKIVGGVPDLIAVLDSQNGSALGTPDYKYGQRVLVVGVTAAPQWTDTPRALEIGALPAFGYDLPYEPLGKYVKPKSVIEEYSQSK